MHSATYIYYGAIILILFSKILKTANSLAKSLIFLAVLITLFCILEIEEVKDIIRVESILFAIIL